MDLNQVMGELDELFAQGRINEVPQFLGARIAQAEAGNEQDILLTLYNECIGFYRETGQYELSMDYCQKAVRLMDGMGLNGTLPYATTLLNAANAYRAAGRLQESLELYNKVKPIYVAQLEEDDMYFAGFYNNLSLLYQEMGDFSAAKEQLQNALFIVSHKVGTECTEFEVAVTQANLANTCIELGQDDEAKARAEEAIRIFEEIGVDDAHYSAALSALGSLYYMDKEYENALAAMEKSRECVAKYLGADNIQYQRLSENIGIIKDKMAAQAALPEAAESGPMGNEPVGNGLTEDVLPENEPVGSGLTEDVLPGNEPVGSGLTEDVLPENEVPGDEPSEKAYDKSDFDEAEIDALLGLGGTDALDEENSNAQYVKNESVAEGGGYDAADGEANQGDMPEDSALDAVTAEVMDETAVEVGSGADEDTIHMDQDAGDSEQDNDYGKLSEEAYSDGTIELPEAEPGNPQDAIELLGAEPGNPQDAIELPEAEPVSAQDAAILSEAVPVSTQDAAGSSKVLPGFTQETAVPADSTPDLVQNDAEPAGAMPEHGQDASMPPELEQETAASTETEPDYGQGMDTPSDTAQEYEDLKPELTGLELCRRYYEEYGRPMIAEKFHAYESVIAVGLVGKGSDCFGFDDIQSRDHDFGPRFVMWVTKKVYEQIGEELEAAYRKLPKSFMGVDRIETFHGKDRAGVMVIEDFYKNLLGFDLVGALVHNSAEGKMDKESLPTIKSWLAVHDFALAAAVNGEIFRDDEGLFTRYRNRLLEYYPKPVWYRKIAQTCALFSQNGQYNLPRMRKRGQLVSAEMAKTECIKQAMRLYYLLNRQYAPHDKWLFKGMPENPAMAVHNPSGETETVVSLVEKISLLPTDRAHEEELTLHIESLAVIFANELERQNIIGSCDLYLDACTAELTAKSDALLTAIVAGTPVVTALSLSIAKTEFEAFDKVQNEGGRASCQNNWPTFKVMRMSQYMTWTEDMLLQYLYEFKTNYANGRNMIEEKYARMMESTAPEKFAAFADRLPPISPEKKAILEQIISLQVKWMEEFAAEYPKLAGNARIIHTSDDLPYDTSYETYLRGELGTYSDRMLDMYGRYIVEHARSCKNVAREIMENTIHFYGYKDFATANEKGI